MKKAIIVVLTALALVAVTVPSEKAQAQVPYCGLCCDISPFTGLPRARRVLIGAIPCGATCVCAGVAGAGFACN